MKLDQQRQWYEEWHGGRKPDLPVEALKQQMRLEAIHALLERVQFQSALVIGCGSGDELRLLNTGRVVAFDLSHGAAEQARQQLPDNDYLQADGMRLPFRDSVFDLVLSSEVIEHILEPDQMMGEVQRVLKPGGHLLLSTPNWLSFFGLARWLAEAVLRRPVTSDQQPVDRWSTPQSLSRLIGQAGIDIVTRRGAWYFPPTGLGMKRLPDAPAASVFRRFLPLERYLSAYLPGYGHLLVVLAQRR